MKKVFTLVLMIFLLLIGYYSDSIYSQVTQIVNIAVEKATYKYVPVRDATRGDNPSQGVISSGTFIYDGTNLKLMRGDTTYGIWTNLKNVTVSNTLSDSYTNPTNALNVGSFEMIYNGTTWDRWRGNQTSGAYVDIRGLNVSNTLNDAKANPTNALNVGSYGLHYNGSTWDLERVFWNSVSCNNVGAVGPCTSINISTHPMTKHTWTVIWTGSPTSAQVDLQGSLDGTNWFTLDSSTTTTSEMRHVVDKGVMYYRGNVVSVTGGTTPAVTVQIASFRD